MKSRLMPAQESTASYTLWKMDTGLEKYVKNKNVIDIIKITPKPKPNPFWVFRRGFCFQSVLLNHASLCNLFIKSGKLYQINFTLS